ncbi:transmembrane protein 267 [Leptopilina boulardi]|uniref:transmembrane protein 267 n=1 Tax=Leptopilina boulardi TaxID=63433 RepID=UPI0021F6628E|nr:transmembrane protein 267 [Leptopilina boulardi]
MFSIQQKLILQLLFTSLIGITSYIGDRLLQQKSEILRAVSDNFTHATVSGLTWSLILIISKKSVLKNISKVFLCFFIASFVDVDHFLIAISWRLQDAMHLQKRGFLHCSTIPIMTWLFLLIYSKMLNQPNISDYGWIILSSFLSHHIRDANRRGLWFCPFGSTRPIPYYFYLSLSMAFPYFIEFCMSLLDTQQLSEKRIYNTPYVI